MNKGIVMEIDAQSIIVLTPGGSFERIPAKDRKCEIGEEILFASPAAVKVRQPVFAAVSVVAAAVVLCLMLFTGLPAVFADKSVVAYVTMDINPSVELGIDSREKVREARGVNDQGKSLLSGISFKGKDLDEVADKLLQQAEAKEYFKQGEGDIIIASTVVKDGADVNDATLTEKLKQQVMAHVLKVHPQQASQISVTAFTAPSEVRETAQEQGLSVGKYSIYLNAKSTGRDVKVDDFKQDSVHTLAKEAGGISKLVEPSKLSKDAIKELLKEEKDGSLDKTVEEHNAKASAKTGKNSPTPKPSAASAKPGTITPKPTVTVKPSFSDKDDKKNDDKKIEGKKNDGKKDDSKEDDGKKETGSATPSHSPKDDKENGKKSDDKKDDTAKPAPTAAVKEEDRKTSGPSANGKTSDGKKEDKKDDKKEDKKEDKKD